MSSLLTRNMETDSNTNKLNNVLKIDTIRFQGNDQRKTKQKTGKQINKSRTELELAVSVENKYRKLKMIHEETNLKLHQKKDKAGLAFTWEVNPFDKNKETTNKGEHFKISDQLERNKTIQDIFIDIRNRQCTEVKLPPIEGTKIPKLSQVNRLPLQACDVSNNPWYIRNLESDKNQSIDQKVFSREYLSRQSTCVIPFKSKPQSKQKLSDTLNRSLKDPTLISQLYNSMSSLRLDNRQDLAANDHVRHHIKRQQQWIRSEQVKNWRKSPASRVKKQTYPNSTSSGQKSDVISGNSDESMHTTSMSSEAQPIIHFEYDEERKEAIDKCLKWMDNLPSKFSGLHILDPAKS